MKRYLKELVLLLAVFGGLPFDVASDTAYAQTPPLRVNGIKVGTADKTAYVTAYGADPTGVADSTTAIQNAVNTLGLNGGTVYFPQGVYKITAAITVPQISGARVVGFSRLASVIKQATSNTPIFDFTTCDSSQFEVSGLTLTYTTPQTSSNTASIALYFDGTSGAIGNGFYNFTLRDLDFSNGYRGVGMRAVNLGVWGWTLENVNYESTQTGALVAIDPSGIGNPNIRISRVYIRADSLSEDAIRLQGAHGLLLDNIEINNGTIGGAGHPNDHVLLTTCFGVVINAFRSENATIATNFDSVMVLSQVYGVVNGAEIQTLNIAAATTGYAIRSISSGVMSAESVTVSAGSIGGAGQLNGLAGDWYSVTGLTWGITPGSNLFDGGATYRYSTASAATTFGGLATFTAGATASGAVPFNLSGSSGAFQTPTGAATFNGSTNSYTGFTKYTGTASSVPASPWTSLSLLNSWVQASTFGVPSYFKDASGVVHLKGAVSTGSSATAVIATLPAGFRPLATILAPAESNGGAQVVQISSNGNIQFVVGSTVRESLEGVSFLAEQ